VVMKISAICNVTLFSPVKNYRCFGKIISPPSPWSNMKASKRQVCNRLCGLVESSWLQIQRSRVRYPELPNFLRSSGSGTGSTQPREDN
jgi:hypothetical protein